MIKRALLVRVMAVVGLGFVDRAHAFPEMIRYGYVNCVSCHVSPAGGGVLTPYGRQSATDLLSTWSTEKEAGLAEGWLTTPSWLNVGGDLRAIEIYRNTPQVSAARFLDMQEDLEAAVTLGKFTVDVNAGLYMEQGALRRFYLNYRPIERVSIRAGKFQQAYGLMEADHSTPVRRGLHWNEGSESYNLEVAWLGENLNAFVTGNFGPEDSKVIPAEYKEKGVAARVGIPFWDRYQAGLSYFRGKSQAFSRDVAGPWAILGFTKHFFLLSEFDYQKVYGGRMAGGGFVTWNRLDYEVIQGLHGLLTYGMTHPLNPNVRSAAWGLGVNWYPRPHFDFGFLWQFQRKPGFGTQSLDYVTLMMHYYL